jgi:hypothetical protein
MDARNLLSSGMMTSLPFYSLSDSVNPMKMTVSFKGHGEDILHLVLFIDDLLSTCKNLQAIKSLEQSLIKKYKTVTFKYGNIHEYLGAELDFSTTIRIVNKVEQLLPANSRPSSSSLL